MALMTIAQRHGRPGTPTDPAHVESFFGHLKGEWPHLETIHDPHALQGELARVGTESNTVRLHAAIGYVTPTTNTTAAGPPSAAPAPPVSSEHTSNASSTTAPTAPKAPHDLGSFPCSPYQRVRHTSPSPPGSPTPAHRR
jgi:hypothetical protein